MNTRDPKTRNKVEPSTRDSISSWLDVLTGMLVMPESQRDQVRDELEDHLRSRVDDLLIVGKSESEAIQIAVAELGETAELAKLITHAHTPINPRRKVMNTTLIAVALAGMSFGGFSFINGTESPGATPSNSGAVPVVVPEEHAKTTPQDFDINQASMMEILNDIGRVFDLGVELSSDSMREPFISAYLSHGGRFRGSFTQDQAIVKFNNVFAQDLLDYKVVVEDGTIHVLSKPEYMRGLVETRVYPIPEWIGGTEADLFNYVESLKSLLIVKYDPNYTSIQTIGGSIIVAAPPEIHEAIVSYAVSLENVLREQQEKSRERARAYEDEQRAQNEQMREAQELRAEQRRQERERTIDEIQQEFDRVRDSLIQSQVEVDQLNEKIAELGNVFQGGHQDDPHQRTQQLKELKIRRVDAELRYEEYHSRYNYLRDTLIESEYAALFEGLE